MYNAGRNQPFSASTTFNNVSLSDPQLNVQTGTTIGVPILVGNITGLNANMYKLPVSYQYSAGVQRSLNSRTVLNVMYVGTQTRHQSDYQEWELPNAALLPALVASNSQTQYNQNVPYLGFGSLRMAQNEANGHYNSLQAECQRTGDQRPAVERGLHAFTVNRRFNTGNSAGDLSNVSNPYAGWRYDVGPSYFDRTNVAFVNLVYDMPFFRDASSRFVRTVVGGWQLSGIVNIMSGAPLNMTYNGTSVCSVVPNCINRPDVVGTLITRTRLPSGSTRQPLQLRSTALGGACSTVRFADRDVTTGICPCSRISSSANRAAARSSSVPMPSTFGTIRSSRAT